MNIRLILGIMFISIIPINTFSQNIFFQGYIVKLNGDTLNGLIQEFSNDFPKKIEFRRFDLSTQLLYKPETIKAFGIKDGASYESKKINDVQLFCKVIIKGKISIFQFKEQYFIESDSAGFISLNNIPYTNDIGKKFQNKSELLYTVFHENPTLKYSADTLNNEDIISLACQYNHPNNQNCLSSYTTKQFPHTPRIEIYNKLNFNYGFTFGSNYYNLNITHSINRISYPGLNNYSNSYFMGFYIKTPISQNVENLYLRLEADITSKSSFYYYEQVKDDYNRTHRNDNYISFQFIKIPIFLQYKLPYFNSLISLDLGFSYNYAFNVSSKRIEEIENTTHIVNTKLWNDLIFNNIETTYIVGVNFNYLIKGQRLSTGLRLEKSASQWISRKSINSYYSSPFDQTSNQFSLIFGIHL